MQPPPAPSRSDPLLPASVRLFLAPEVADALEVVVRTLHDQALDGGVAGLEEGRAVAEARAAAQELAAIRRRLERIGGYGEEMSLDAEEVAAVAAAALDTDLAGLQRAVDRTRWRRVGPTNG